MNSTTWTQPQWYAKLCIGKNGRSRLGWSLGEKVVLKVTSTLVPERNKNKIYWHVSIPLGPTCFQKGPSITFFLYLKGISVLRVSLLSHTNHHHMKPVTPKHLEMIVPSVLEHEPLSTRTRNMPDLVEFEVSEVGVSLDYKWMSIPL